MGSQGGEHELSPTVERAVVTPQCISWNSTLRKGNQDSEWIHSNLEEEWETSSDIEQGHTGELGRAGQ